MNGVVGITHVRAIAGDGDLSHDVRRQQAWQTSLYIIADEPTAPFFAAKDAIIIFLDFYHKADYTLLQ